LTVDSDGGERGGEEGCEPELLGDAERAADNRDEFHAINNDENLWKFYLEDFGPMIFQEKEPKSSGHPKEELQKKFLEDFVLVGQVRFQ